MSKVEEFPFSSYIKGTKGMYLAPVLQQCKSRLGTGPPFLIDTLSTWNFGDSNTWLGQPHFTFC